MNFAHCACSLGLGTCGQEMRDVRVLAYLYAGLDLQDERKGFRLNAKVVAGTLVDEEVVVGGGGPYEHLDTLHETSDLVTAADKGDAGCMASAESEMGALGKLDRKLGGR